MLVTSINLFFPKCLSILSKIKCFHKQMLFIINRHVSPKFCPWLKTKLPNDKLLDWSKLKALANDKLNVAKMTISVFDSVENTLRKGENAGYQHFLLFSQCFPKPSSSGPLKTSTQERQ